MKKRSLVIGLMLMVSLAAGCGGNGGETSSDASRETASEAGETSVIDVQIYTGEDFLGNTAMAISCAISIRVCLRSSFQKE